MTNTHDAYGDALVFDDLILAENEDERVAMLAEIQRRIDDQKAVDDYYGVPHTPMPSRAGTGDSRSDRLSEFLRSKDRAGLPAETRIEQV